MENEGNGGLLEVDQKLVDDCQQAIGLLRHGILRNLIASQHRAVVLCAVIQDALAIPHLLKLILSGTVC